MLKIFFIIELSKLANIIIRKVPNAGGKLFKTYLSEGIRSKQKDEIININPIIDNKLLDLSEFFIKYTEALAPNINSHTLPGKR